VRISTTAFTALGIGERFIWRARVVCMIMPDTKSGREKSGQKKREQLRQRLYEQELETLDEDADLPEFGDGEDGFAADEL